MASTASYSESPAFETASEADYPGWDFWFVTNEIYKNVNISFAMSACPFIHMQHLYNRWKNFCEHLECNSLNTYRFEKMLEEN
jgi:hypothetical protein